MYNALILIIDYENETIKKNAGIFKIVFYNKKTF